MDILFTLCGRAGSKGFKNKNLKKFLKLPLIYYSAAAIALYKECAASVGSDIDAVLNTDSEDLIRLMECQKMLPISIIRRESLLGGDSVPKVSVISDCLNQMEEKKGKKYDMVVDLDITSPLRTLSDICNAIEKKRSRSDTDVVYSVTDSRRNPYFNMVKEENGYFCKAIPSSYTARQQVPVFYDMNASIYVYSCDALKEKEPETFFNDKCDAIIMKDTGILDIDSEGDFELMQVVARHLFEKEKEYQDVFEEAKKFGDL